MRFIKIILAAALVISPLVIAYYIPRAINIENITCSGQYGRCNDAMMEKLSNAVRNRSLTDAKKKANSILFEDSSIRDYSIRYRLPNLLEVSIVEKSPKYALVKRGSGTIALVDNRGEVVSFVEKTNLPWAITEEALPNVGGMVGEDTLFALKLVYGVALSSEIIDARLEGGNLSINLQDELKVIFPTKGESEILLGSFNLLLSRLNTISKDTKIGTAENIKEIDLRFSNPVLR